MFYDRLLELCKDKNKKITPVIRELGLSTGGIARWRNGSAPDGDTLYKIAEYFDVSVDYLLGLTDEKKPPVKTGGTEDDEDVKAFSDMLDDLSDDELQMVSDFVALLKRKRTP